MLNIKYKDYASVTAAQMTFVGARAAKIPCRLINESGEVVALWTRSDSQVHWYLGGPLDWYTDCNMSGVFHRAMSARRAEQIRNSI